MLKVFQPFSKVVCFILSIFNFYLSNNYYRVFAIIIFIYFGATFFIVQPLITEFVINRKLTSLLNVTLPTYITCSEFVKQFKEDSF